jgi:iron-sulfur cluster assembly protein
MFTLTSMAARQIQEAAANSGAQEMALRIAAKIDPDGSKQYGMGFDDPTEEDMKLDLNGVAVVIAGESQILLADTVLDYVELNPGEFNFIFIDARHFQGEADELPDSGSGCGSGGCATGGCASKGRTH